MLIGDIHHPPEQLSSYPVEVRALSCTDLAESTFAELIE